LAKQFELIEKQTIEAKSIGDWAHAAGISEIDFCKLNIQGAELDVLRGAGPLLGSALGLVAEQTFNATYIGAPLFGETYEFIRGAEFTLFDIIGMNRVARTRSPIHITDDRIFSVTGTWPHHQLLEGHFLYFRDPILNAPEWTSDSLSPERCIKLACIAEVFGQIEFAFELLSWLAGSPRTGNMASRCREIVSNGAELYLAASQMDATVGSASFWERENGRLAAENERILTELRAQASEATRLRGEVAQLTEEREGLFASRSWRLTAPLRATRSFVDGFLQKLSGQQ
jgi:hypothetical protein